MNKTHPLVRTRFAPSPTGHLHLGGARTALFNFLFARHNEGTFILRIEDTDVERSTTTFSESIIESMNWLNLNYEGPYFQSHRSNRYREIAEELFRTGKAYRCYCSKERLEALRERQLANKEKPRYDRHCRDLTSKNADEPFVLRFRNPTEGEVVFEDLVWGSIVINNSELDDLILMRTDGSFTYNFTAAVDDNDMEITHVIRGADHINNTPRQINILKSLSANIPFYAHLPMILGPDGKRLSKRHGAMSVLEYREQGFLPEALVNYLVRLGWSYGDQEIFSLKEMIRLFDVSKISRSPAAFNPEKLLWLNQHYLKTLPPHGIASALAAQLDHLNVNLKKGPSLEAIIALQAGRSKTVREMALRSVFFYEDPETYNPEAAQKWLTEDALKIFEGLQKQLESLTWDQQQIHQVIVDISQEFHIKMGDIAQPLRVAMTGNTVSPPIDATIHLIGKEAVLRRLNKAIHYLKSTFRT